MTGVVKEKYWQPRINDRNQRNTGKVAEYNRIGTYRTCTYGKEFPCEQNSGDVTDKVITIEQAYAVTTIQA